MTSVEKIQEALESSEITSEQAFNYMLELHNSGRTFIHELIDKENTLKIQLVKNMELYSDKMDEHNYRNSFSMWNKCNLTLWDLEDILCRMGEDID